MQRGLLPRSILKKRGIKRNKKRKQIKGGKKKDILLDKKISSEPEKEATR